MRVIHETLRHTRGDKRLTPSCSGSRPERSTAASKPPIPTPRATATPRRSPSRRSPRSKPQRTTRLARKTSRCRTLIKRYFWLLGAVTVVLCAVVRRQGHRPHRRSQVPRDPEHAPKITPVVAQSTAPVAARSKDGGQFSSRNMFLLRLHAAGRRQVGRSVVDRDHVAAAVAAPTNIGPRAEESYATIINSENQKQGAYALGDQIPGATSSGKLKAIPLQVRRLREQRPRRAAGPARRHAAGADPGRLGRGADAAVGRGRRRDAVADRQRIKKIDDNNYVIDNRWSEGAAQPDGGPPRAPASCHR